MKEKIQFCVGIILMLVTDYLVVHFSTTMPYRVSSSMHPVIVAQLLGVTAVALSVYMVTYVSSHINNTDNTGNPASRRYAVDTKIPENVKPKIREEFMKNIYDFLKSQEDEAETYDEQDMIRCLFRMARNRESLLDESKM